MDNEEKPIWNGPCHGGPMNHEDGVSRFPRGFLLVDRVHNRVWIYDWMDDGFYVRLENGSVLINDPEAPKNRWRAAEEAEFDIRAWEDPS